MDGFKAGRWRSTARPGSLSLGASVLVGLLVGRVQSDGASAYVGPTSALTGLAEGSLSVAGVAGLLGLIGSGLLLLRLERNARRLRACAAAFENAPDPLVILDLEGTVLHANPAAVALDASLGYELAPGARTILLQEGRGIDPETRDLLDRAREGAVRDALIPFGSDAEQGGTRWISISAARLADEHGALPALLLIEREVTAARRAARELEQARDQAQASARAKGNFLANINHEIRTPMAAILGHADLLLAGEYDADAERARTAVRVIQAKGTRLLGILDDVLAISESEAGRLEVRREPTDAIRVVEEVVAGLRGIAVDKNLTLVIDWASPVPARIHSNRERLEQVLTKLVDNALKFTDFGGVRVRVACERETRRLSFEVRDTGIGMAPELVARLTDCEAFTQGDAGTTRRHGGVGVGLRVTKTLAQLLGGDLAVRSTVGVGSSFTVTVDTGELDGVGWVDRVRAALPARREAVTAQPLAGRRVLLVEDGPDNQRLISLFLRRAGAEVEIADNGRVALERMDPTRASQRPDLILMDLQMPEVDGYEATATLRGLGCELPIVAVTAHALEADRVRSLSVGCNDFMTKPVDRQTLVDCCARWLEQGECRKRL